MADYEIHWNDAALKEELEGPEGDIYKWLMRVGVRVESQAKLNASGRPGPNVQTGRLRSSITWVIGRDNLGAFVDIGSNVHYAPFVELGTVNMPGGYPFLRPAMPAANVP